MEEWDVWAGSVYDRDFKDALPSKDFMSKPLNG
jgi:hypothetical protein